MSECHNVTVSILNWNSSAVTLHAVRSVLALQLPPHVRVNLVVVDNGSRAEDAAALADALAGLQVRLQALPQNLGFAGGHNVAIREALAKGADFVWLLNSDAIAPPHSLAQLLRLMDEQPRCGAASPVIVRLGQPDLVDFAGAVHDWDLLDSPRPVQTDASRALALAHRKDFWVVGTAVLLRATALREVGLLEERYFAYYEDDDICARLAGAQWHSAMAYDAHVEHACFEGQMFERPPYYFYLMARNAFRFWGRHTPAGKRRWLRLRLLDTWLLYSNRLHSHGQPLKRDACLLGIWDGLLGRDGPPSLQQRWTPWLLQALRLLRLPNHRPHMPSVGV
ncbi:glycosyltransferase [Pseudorhodoferax sp. Leaf267]|uniref:glycosyltransferase n=1 Tax=Pseudorhodoferax sp. Leaf267 TaxID=1736316 RepID=UPI0006F5E3DC|nr:glycosyltransferase family 2 protein [Pseudorhodoferax sp. Leaf267]KQP17315.1 hypothetical protein ASF43_29280 [Pseudorhodoferax sp. Leaf267]